MIYYILLIILLAGALFCAWQISVADFRRRIIPDAYLYPLTLVGLLITAFWAKWPCTVQDAALGAAFGYALGATVGFAFDYFQRRKSPTAPAPIGMGDIKLLGAGGLWLGPTGLAVALVLSCIFGGAWGRIHGKRFIPFAPFFLTGALLTLIAMFFLL